MSSSATWPRRKTAGSQSWFQRGQRVLVEGVSSPSRGPANYDVPTYMTHGEGSHIYDTDGNAYLDLMMGYGALIHGHAHPAIVETITRAATEGTLFATADPLEVTVAERLVSLIPGVDQVRFANTGTEAVMAAIRLARGTTGRRTIVKFEGHYHGWYDAVLVNGHPGLPHQFGHRRDPVIIPDSSGLTVGSFADTRVVPWADLDLVASILSSEAVAAVISEPIMANMGVIPPPPGFHTALANLCHESGAMFILDETVTGCRLAPGGAQQIYDAHADIVTYGKALGAGLPIAALAGSRQIMSGLASGRVLHYGTQNASHLALAVADTSLDLLLADGGEVFGTIATRGDRLAQGLASALRDAGIAAISQNVGPMLQVFILTPQAIARGVREIADFRSFCEDCDRERFRRFAHAMIDKGVYMSPSATLHSVITTSTSDADVEEAIATARDVAVVLAA